MSEVQSPPGYLRNNKMSIMRNCGVERSSAEFDIVRNFLDIHVETKTDF